MPYIEKFTVQDKLGFQINYLIKISDLLFAEYWVGELRYGRCDTADIS